MRVTVVPPHEPCGSEGLGVVTDDGVLVCTVRRRWRVARGGEALLPGAMIAHSERRKVDLIADDECGCGCRLELCTHGIFGHCQAA